MPGGDGTGPLGAGAMSGRAAGFCAGFSVPGWANPNAGRAMGYGGGFGRRGRGRGWRNRFYATGQTGWQRAGIAPADVPCPPAADEVAALKAQAEGLKRALEGIGRRLEELSPAEADGE